MFPLPVGDVLLTADGTRHRVIAVQGQQAVLREDGTETLPDVPWSARETAQPVTSAVRTIGLMGDAALVPGFAGRACESGRGAGDGES